MWPLLAVLDRFASGAEPGPRPEHRAADEEAVRRLARGEADALAALYDRHARAVYSLAVRILHDPADAEDVVQEVFGQAWRQAARFDAARGSVAGWLLTMTRSRAIDRLRADRATPGSAGRAGDRRPVDLEDASPSQDMMVFTGELSARLRSALQALPFLQRTAIEMAYYEGLTQHEIAERLEQPLGTIKTRIRLGLMKLRDALAGVGS
jgi:RNA polymerase sigma-70 factor (ECF subfamily)